MVKSRALIVLTGLLVSSPVLAQFQPTVNVQQLRPDLTRFSREDVDPETEVALRLRWTANHSTTQAYEAEVTYDAARTPENPDQRRVVYEVVETADTSFIASSQSGRTYEIFVLPSNILPAEAVPARGGEGIDGVSTEEGSRQNIVVRVGPAGGDYSMANNGTATWQFEYDTLPPAAPTVTSTVPGEDRVQVNWVAPGERSQDVFTYQVVYCPMVTTATVAIDESVRLSALPCPEDEWRTASSGRTVTSLFISEDLVNGQPAAVAVRAIDAFGNVGPLSDAWIAVPKDVTDFYELYRQQGGLEDGGFCFVATAAYGSYAHPVVQALRAFRDAVLDETPFGRAFVWAYYEAAPPAARALAGRPGLAALARVLLILVTAAVFLACLVPLFVFGIFALRWLRPGKKTAAAGLVAVLGVLGAAGEARAERPRSSLGDLGLAFEFKGGPFLPAEGNADADNQAFGRVFGTNPGAMFKFGAELQVWKGFGTVSVGGSIGYQRFSGFGRFNDDQGAATEILSEDATRLFLLPTSLVGIYRFDYLAEKTWLPLVPYVKGGLAYTFWWSTNGRGNISRVEGAADDGGDLVARGGKLGLTGAVGMSFLMNALEPRAAASLFNSTNIRGTYLFAELEATKADGFSSEGFDLSDLSWNLGLMLEF